MSHYNSKKGLIEHGVQHIMCLAKQWSVSGRYRTATSMTTSMLIVADADWGASLTLENTENQGGCSHREACCECRSVDTGGEPVTGGRA